MATLLNPNYKERSLPKEFVLFDDKPNNIVIESEYKKAISCQLTPSGGVFNFHIPPNKLFNPKDSYLHIKYKVTKEDGTAISDSDNVSTISLPPNTFFKTCEIYLNNTLVSTNRPYFHFESYLYYLMKSGTDGQLPFVTNIDDASEYINNDGVINRQFQGPSVVKDMKLFSPFFNIDKYIMSDVNVEIRLDINDYLFFIWSSATIKVKFIVEDINFIASFVEPIDAFMKTLNIQLKQSPAIYCSADFITKQYTIPTNTTKLFLNNIFNTRPTVLFLYAIKSSNLTGDITKNPLNTADIKAKSINIYFDRELQNGQSYTYLHKSETTLAMTLICEYFSESQKNSLLPFTYINKYDKTIYPFILKPLVSEPYIPLKYDNNISIELEIKTALTAEHTLFVTGYFENIITIDQNRNVLKISQTD